MRIAKWALIAVGVLAYTIYVNTTGLPTSVGDPAPLGPEYFVILVVGAVLLVVVAGWHSVWIYPVALLGFALFYEAALWDPAPGAPTMGTDSIGYYPAGRGFLLFVLTPLVWALAVVRALLVWTVSSLSARTSRA